MAILESRCEPWFEDAAVNTVVTILERCSNKAERDNNIVKFVKVKKKLAELIPWDIKLDALNRWQGLDEHYSANRAFRRRLPQNRWRKGDKYP